MRDLRTADPAAGAGLSTALVFYHFRDRAGLLRRTLGFITDRARQHAVHPGAEPPADPVELLGAALRLEFQDLSEVREYATTWGSCGPA
ncbi:hypothetical protein ACF064_35745 [Streptomyces sp. NPDC015492]|uniref:hypothetical protein n=1 Tax=Streptomyces sp. NPDC015492 TaxID=3364958 RepID=UPI0036F5E685